jgi:prepilin-type N-terminal cleavage/methylation domain-containing protein
MNSQDTRGFSLVEVLIVMAILSIVAAIAIPGLLRARMTGNETSAIASLRVTASSQVAYTASCGNGGYASSYAVLGTPPAGVGEGFISPDLGHAPPVVKSGYAYTLAAGLGSAAGANDCNGTATISAYLASASAQDFGTTGARQFVVNAGNTIWQSTTLVLPAEPLSVGPTVMPIQ